MALYLRSSNCVHCGEPIVLRRYAAGSWDKTGAHVDLWTTGGGAYPGDQRFCESHVIDSEGSIGDHEPEQ